MEIGVFGLGKMGFNIALNLKEHRQTVYGYDLDKEARKKAEQEGIPTFDSIDSILDKMPNPKVIWVMVPSGHPTENIICQLYGKLGKDDILIDAGNSNYKDSIRRAEMVSQKGIKYLDAGTSGGTSGARYGACLMVGGPKEAYQKVEPVLKAISEKDGCLYTGQSGSGHFMKMVHNGIEYGMMQAIGEGFQIMEESNFHYDLEAVAANWNHGSVIRGWLMELAQEQFKENPHLENFKGIVDASGEAKWTVETALELEVPAPVITLALMMRNRTKEEDSFSAKVVSALRNGFGGHSFVEVDIEKK